MMILADAYQPDEWGAYGFASLSSQTKLEVKDVRRACRSLAKKGLAQYERTLWNEDSGPAGAGYRATEIGAAFVAPCHVCGARATYDYKADSSGKMLRGIEMIAGVRVLECEDHYGHYKENLKASPVPLPI